MRVFDLHCDTLTYQKRRGRSLADPDCQLILEDAKAFDAYIQLFAVFVPDNCRGQRAGSFFSAHHAYYRRQLEELGDALYEVRHLRSLKAAANRRGMSSILSVEGGHVLGGELEKISELKNAGVRALTITWNGDNELAGGVSGSGGLTPLGAEAIPLLEKAGIAVDVSHLSERSFWDVLEHAKLPPIASHSNAKALCSHPRNLTDDQFEALMERGGLVGITFADLFIIEGGEGASMDHLIEHIQYFLDLGGRNTLALGSDFDGASLPGDLTRPRALLLLCERLLQKNISEQTVKNLFFENAFRYFSALFSGGFETDCEE